MEVKLPAGIYSDDTQLRLAVSRAIRSSGFDAEAFAKIELPVWTAYALGGGRATKAAAVNIASPTVPWFANFFRGWQEAGGNGVAMRIQPHVWASQRPLEGDFVGGLLEDAVVTHGHPRAIVGAVFHSITLAACLGNGRIPEPEDWGGLLSKTGAAAEAIRGRTELTEVWLKNWTATFPAPWEDEWRTVVGEIEEMLSPATAYVKKAQSAGPVLQDYLDLAEAIGGAAKATRGSGTVTAVMALALAAAGVRDPYGFLRMGCLALGTDTDTVASMAGALIGSAVDGMPPTRVLDQEYIVNETTRLALIASGSTEIENFRYPDLLHWIPPRTQSDAVGINDGSAVIAGLGKLAKPLALAGDRGEFGWSWGNTKFGQTVLVKHRLALPELPNTQMPSAGVLTTQQPSTVIADNRRGTISRPPSVEGKPNRVVNRVESEQSPLSHAMTNSPKEVRPSPVDLDGMLKWLGERNYRDSDIGYAVRRICEAGNLAQLATFTTALAERLRTHAPTRVTSGGPANARGSSGYLPRSSVNDVVVGWARVETAMRRALADSDANDMEAKALADLSPEQLIEEVRGRNMLSAPVYRAIRQLLRDRNELVHMGSVDAPLAREFSRRARNIYLYFRQPPEMTDHTQSELPGLP